MIYQKYIYFINLYIYIYVLSIDNLFVTFLTFPSYLSESLFTSDAHHAKWKRWHVR